MPMETFLAGMPFASDGSLDGANSSTLYCGGGACTHSLRQTHTWRSTSMSKQRSRRRSVLTYARLRAVLLVSAYVFVSLAHGVAKLLFSLCTCIQNLTPKNLLLYVLTWFHHGSIFMKYSIGGNGWVPVLDYCQTQGRCSGAEQTHYILLCDLNRTHP